jgi:hypothetical protein
MQNVNKTKMCTNKKSATTATPMGGRHWEQYGSREGKDTLANGGKIPGSVSIKREQAKPLSNETGSGCQNYPTGRAL